MYTVDFGKVTGVDGKQARGATPTTETWGFRSVCRPEGCVANASRLSGDTMQIPTMVFDQVGDSWVAVGVGSTNCGKAVGEVWEVFTLQPRPDGTLAGESNQLMAVGCANKRPVTFTRTGDVDVNTVPDPATLPPRVISPAEALRGHYRETDVTPNGYRDQADYVVSTDCLRTGDRCMSFSIDHRLLPWRWYSAMASRSLTASPTTGVQKAARRTWKSMRSFPCPSRLRIRSR